MDHKEFAEKFTEFPRKAINVVRYDKVRTCVRCGKEFRPWAYISKKTNNIVRRADKCIDCVRIFRLSKSYTKIVKLTPEQLAKQRIHKRAYYEAHKEKYAAYNKAYRKKHRERISALVLRWQRRNRERYNAKCLIRNAKYRATEKGKLRIKSYYDINIWNKRKKEKDELYTRAGSYRKLCKKKSGGEKVGVSEPECCRSDMQEMRSGLHVEPSDRC